LWMRVDLPEAMVDTECALTRFALTIHRRSIPSMPAS